MLSHDIRSLLVRAPSPPLCNVDFIVALAVHAASLVLIKKVIVFCNYNVTTHYYAIYLVRYYDPAKYPVVHTFTFISSGLLPVL